MQISGENDNLSFPPDICILDFVAPLRDYLSLTVSNRAFLT